MNRKAELLNLRDVRDLEMAKLYIANQRYYDWNNVYQVQIDKLSIGNYVKLREIRGEIESAKKETIAVVFGCCAIIFALFIWFTFEDGWIALFSILAGYVALKFFAEDYFGTLRAAQKEKEDIEWNAGAMAHNAEEKKRVDANHSKIIQLQQKQKARDNYWVGESNKVNNLLKEAYDVNIIPNQYRRNLAAIQYIYEYMSTSQVSLEHVLLATKIEEGIQRIEAKLNTIIANQEEIIFNMHIQEATNQKIMAQNAKMLRSLEQNERNTMEAAQYAKISANYAGTCSYFAIAEYLRKR